MWPELKKELVVEQQMLRRLVTLHESLLVKCQTTPPDTIEISALAALLHSFYTGTENLFKRIALHLDGGLPSGDMWHTRLLDSMATPTAVRPAAITEALGGRLRLYLGFRHVFRHAYAFELRWSKMAPLVQQLAETLELLEKDVGRFVAAMDSGPSAAAPKGCGRG